jgi:hypothetical protein
MIAIALDDSACVAVGSKGRCIFSSDLIWTGAGWIVADIGDAEAMQEAHSRADLGEVVGFRDAMCRVPGQGHACSRLEYLAALFKQCAQALRDAGEEDVSRAVIAMPAAASYWATGALAQTDIEGVDYYTREDAAIQRDFERAAQIAGFHHVRVQPAAVVIYEIHPDRVASMAEKRGRRSAVVELFRTGFSITPVGHDEGSPAQLRGRPVFVNFPVEVWVVDRLRAAAGEIPSVLAKSLQPLMRTSLVRETVPTTNALQHGIPMLIETRQDLFDGAWMDQAILDGSTKISREAIQFRLRDAAEDKDYLPEYYSIFVCGWLTANTTVKSAFTGFLFRMLKLDEQSPIPYDVSLTTIAACAYERAAAEGHIPASSAESVRVETASESIDVSGDTRPAIDRLPWLIEGEPNPMARVTLQRGKASRSYRVIFSPEPWELHSRAEIEVSIEHDDRVCVTTLIDGRPAPADVRDDDDHELQAIAPGKFELYLGPEHRLVTEISRRFERGPHGAIARFQSAAVS